ncbi:hypothetical protein GDO81_029946 [Engystomops pustulosus]|uniref:Uncharacterized protein n=1 Tax=Engystomops pustulosus TaxID=76066 RepID=A0AAV6YD00_ENGPU|nr:hypothetical protein GDO81_029946 [Engystomops pustulosus]
MRDSSISTTSRSRQAPPPALSRRPRREPSCRYSVPYTAGEGQAPRPALRGRGRRHVLLSLTIRFYFSYREGFIYELSSVFGVLHPLSVDLSWQGAACGGCCYYMKYPER